MILQKLIHLLIKMSDFTNNNNFWPSGSDLARSSRSGSRSPDRSRSENAIWHLGPCQIEPRSGILSAVWFSGRSGFYVCLDFVFSRALSSLENTLFSKLWRAPDRFDFPTEPDRHNFPIGPDRHHFPIAFSCQIEGIARSSQIA